ncbi:MAG: hypothetical protein AAFR61_32175 [Bacteroidota bacterium]
MRSYLFTLIAFFFLLSGCQQEQDIYLYEVNPVDVTQDGANKQNLKSDLEFLSLAFSDLFGQTVPNSVLNMMVTAYNSLGDKTLVADILIRNMLNSPQAQVPGASEMRNNPQAFITATFNKFYIRDPQEYEIWFLTDLIENDQQITPEIIWYAVLTSDEYRYF